MKNVFGICKKYIWMLLVVAILTIIVFNLKISVDFNKLLENEKIEDLCLTIYYKPPYILNNHNWSKQNLIDNVNDKKIVVCGEELKGFINIYCQVDRKCLQYAFKKSQYLDADVYYVLESKKKGKIFDVLMTGIADEGQYLTVWINGIEYKYQDVFIDAISSYLPE